MVQGQGLEKSILKQLCPLLKQCVNTNTLSFCQASTYNNDVDIKISKNEKNYLLAKTT